MKVSNETIELIKHFEGLHLDAYECPASVAGNRFYTIGFGTTIYPNGTRVQRGDRITVARAEELLKNDIEQKYAKHVRESVIFSKLKNSNEFGALVSFVYNVGRGGLHAPNSINRRIRNGEDYVTVVTEELPRWNKGGGRVLPGLVRRRQAELELFMTPVEEDSKVKLSVGDVNGEVKLFQKSLNVWLRTWNKLVLVEDGIFGGLTLAAAQDFARNNKLPKENHVTKELFDRVVSYAESVQPSIPEEQTGVKVYNRGADISLAKNFHLSEFTCKCGRCRNQLVDLGMVAKLQKLRDILGVPLYITSAYRCAVHNSRIGSMPNSRHTKGDAVDISIGNINWGVLVEEAKNVGFTGIGYGQNRGGFIHLDTWFEREWNY